MSLFAKPKWTSPCGRVVLYNGDCLAVLPALEMLGVDAIVSDPPYGLDFMGNQWDHGVPGSPFWEKASRACKPGAHMLAFGGTRTYHRLGVAIENAGWEVRDCLMWLYGSGFPKSHNISKAIDKSTGFMGNEGGGMLDTSTGHMTLRPRVRGDKYRPPEPVTAAARAFAGCGTALKPAWEPIWLARKALDGTVAQNMMNHGVGALHIDACRVPTNGEEVVKEGGVSVRGANVSGDNRTPTGAGMFGEGSSFVAKNHPGGRWPANVMHDGSAEAVRDFPDTTSKKTNGVTRANGVPKHGGQNARPSHDNPDRTTGEEGYDDSGNASRFFKCCQQDPTCTLCGSPYGVKSAEDSPSESLVQAVRSAGSLCDSCATNIVAALAEQRTAPNPERLHGWGSISEPNGRILTRCLASFAALLGNTDTTPTTQSLNLLFGCVRDAMQSSTPTDATASESGHPSRLCYIAKAGKGDRDEGLDHLELRPAGAMGGSHDGSLTADGKPVVRRNVHPTVKPTELMAWCVRLITPDNGLVLDPFMGSGSTGKGAVREGRRFVGIELNPEYFEIARARIMYELEKQRAGVAGAT